MALRVLTDQLALMLMDSYTEDELLDCVFDAVAQRDKWLDERQDSR